MTLSINGRVGLTSGLLAIMLVVIGCLGLYGMVTSNAAFHITFANQLPAVRDIGNTNLFATRERLALGAALDEMNTPGVDSTIANGLDFRKQSDQAWAMYMAIPHSAESAALSDVVQAKRALLQAMLDKGYAAVRAKDTATARTIVAGLPDAYNDMGIAITKLLNFLTGKAQHGYDNALSTFDTVRTLTIAALLLGVALAAYSWYALRQAIGVPLRQALAIFDAIAEGDLRNKVVIRSADEMGQLMQGLDRMQTSLIKTVGTVRSGSESIATATQQIAAGNIDLSSRTEEQASALQETAASMEQLTGTVKQNADNARQASMLAGTASDIANKGSSVVTQVVDTMGEINRSSAKISDIITIIEGIAFQTNILALNAAVEAARAGEEGRGFAVVAGEVRNLAQRSSSAAKEIKTLIDASVNRVQSGTQLVDEAGRTMTEIIGAVQRVTDIMGEIAAASGEQSNGIDQVALAVSQMDEATQQNAALVEEAAAAAQSLQDQATKLRQAVAIFKMDDDDVSLGGPVASLPRKVSGGRVDPKLHFA
jgi:methyl-accepting chemotaxis protein-1 (serine sensor receptor)